MSSQEQRRRNGLTSAVAGALAFGAAGAVLLATRHGVGTYNDSLHYMSAARSLAAGNGYRDFTGERLATFPPLFSTLLAVGIKLGLGMTAAVRLVNAAAYTATVVFAWLLVRRHVRSQVIGLAAVALIAFSLTLQRLADKALSESVFIALALAGLLVFEVASRTSGRRGYLLLTAAGSIYGAAFLDRHVGVTLAVAGVISLVLSRDVANAGVAKMTARSGVLLVSWSVLPAAWLLRNSFAGVSPLTVARQGLGSSPLDSFRPLALALGAVFLPAGSPSALAYMTFVVAILVFAAAAFLAVKQERRRPEDSAAYTFLPVLVLIGTYSAFTWFSYWRGGSSLDARIMSPVFVLVIVSAAYVLDHLRDMVWGGLPHWARVVTVVAVGTFVLLACSATLLIARHVGQRIPPEYADPALANSPVAQAVRALPAGAVVASNNPYLLYSATGHTPTEYSPGHVLPSASLRPPTVAEFRRQACAMDTFVAWFGPSDKGTDLVLTLDRVSQRIKLDEVERLEDGSIQRVSKGAACKNFD